MLLRNGPKVIKEAHIESETLQRYLSSIDALQPVLAKLTEEEWEKFDAEEFELVLAVSEIPIADLAPWQYKKYQRLLKPNQLARCIVKAIKPTES